MKKFLVIVGLVAVAIMIALLLRQGDDQPTVAMAKLVPAGTAIYLELPNLNKSAERWQQTGLAAIAAEPEMAAFLEKPLAATQELSQSMPLLEPFWQLDVVRAFLAVGNIDQPIPQLCGGFQFQGGQQALDAALAKVKDYVLTEFPAGQADVQQIMGHSVRTYTTEQWKLASTRIDDWYYIANDLAALEALLRKQQGQNSEDSLADHADYQQALAHLPTARESLVYLDMQQIGKRLAALSAAAGQPVASGADGQPDAVRAIAATTSFDGTQLHDSAFFVMDDADLPTQRLSHTGLSRTSRDTIFYYSDLLVLPEQFQLPDPALDQTGLLRPVTAIIEQLEQKGFDAAAFDRAFGPEYSIQSDWQQETQRPTFIISVDVSEREVAGLILEELTSGNLGLPPFQKQQLETGETLYSLTKLGTIPVHPALCLTPDQLFISDDATALTKYVATGENGQNQDDSELMAMANTSSQSERTAFGYLNTKSAFTRTYSLLRPTALLMAAFMPGINKNVDLSKLPNTETVAKHLEPVVFSQSVVEGGLLYESQGTLTMNQFLIGGIGGAAAIGYLSQTMGELFKAPDE